MKKRHAIRRPHSHGLSMIEVVVSTMLVSVVLIGALKCVGAMVRARATVDEETVARHLAQQLLAEIVSQDYIDSDLLPLFGPEALEPLVSVGPRSGWDDVDDYHLWVGYPPEDRNGLPLPGSAGFRREVRVEWVNPENPQAVSLVDLGLKRITVTVGRGSSGNILAQAVALRSQSSDGNG